MARPHRRLGVAIRLFAFGCVAVVVGACSNGPGSGPTLTPTLRATAGVTASPTVTEGLSETPSAGKPTAVAGGIAGKVPAFSHVWILVLENANFASVIDGASDPYLLGLVSKYGLAANYYGVSHPSQPNYLALFSGSMQGVADDGLHDISAPNLADQLEAKGKTWTVYEQDYPGNCFAGTTANGQGEGFGVAGSYARKHDPAISFDDIRTDPSRCGRIRSLAGFDPTAADFELIVPNTCNDLHSCPLATADAFLATFVPHILAAPDFGNSVLFITTDEGEGSGQNQVATLVVSPLVKAGMSSTTRHDHYSLLRTIEDAWGLGCLAESCNANNMAEFFAQ